MATSAMAAPRMPFGAGPAIAPWIGGKAEQRPRKGLRCPVSGKEGVIADPSLWHHFRLQQRQHDMAAPEHQRPGPVEGIEQGHALRHAGRQWQQDEQQAEEGERAEANRLWNAKLLMSALGCAATSADPKARKTTDHNGGDLAHGSARKDHDQYRGKRDAGPLAVGRKGAHHAPDRLCDHGHGNHLQTVNKAKADRPSECGGPEGEQDQKECRWRRERRPCGQRAERTAAQQAECEASLAAGRTGKELAQRHEVGISGLVDPFAPRDQLVTEIAKMG